MPYPCRGENDRARVAACLRVFCDRSLHRCFSPISKNREKQEIAFVNERVKLGLFCLVWLLVLVYVGLSAANTLQAASNFQQQYTGTRRRDVNAIRPWMTIQVISHVYLVPEDYLCGSVKIAKTDPLRKATLYTVASRKRQPVTQVIHVLQYAILTYRKEHPHTSQAQPLWSRVKLPVPEERVT